MASSRARIARFIAAILAIAFSAQIAGAQSGNCTKMSASHGSAGHSEMPHRAGTDALKAGTGASQTQTAGSPGCSETILCMNAPAVLNVTHRTVGVRPIALPISFDPTAIEARALPPDSPPPKH